MTGRPGCDPQPPVFTSNTTQLSPSAAHSEAPLGLGCVFSVQRDFLKVRACLLTPPSFFQELN